MSTAIIQKSNSSLESQQDRNALEVRVALNANLWAMPDEQVWAYYRWMSERLELDPMSHPFDVITDAKQQIKKLYPNSSCTSQLGEKRKLSYGKMDMDVNQAMLALGFKVVHVAVEVRSPDGRSLVAEAFVDLMSGYEGKPLAGNNLINALKKAGTQCRRRGTLQMLGLALPSEEIPTVKLGDIERTDGDTNSVIIEHPPASALIDAPKPDAKSDSGKLTDPRKTLLLEIVSELGAKGVGKARLQSRAVQICERDDVSFSNLTSDEIELLIECFSIWIDSFA